MDTKGYRELINEFGVLLEQRKDMVERGACRECQFYWPEPGESRCLLADTENLDAYIPYDQLIDKQFPVIFQRHYWRRFTEACFAYEPHSRRFESSFQAEFFADDHMLFMRYLRDMKNLYEAYREFESGKPFESFQFAIDYLRKKMVCSTNMISTDTLDRLWEGGANDG